MTGASPESRRKPVCLILGGVGYARRRSGGLRRALAVAAMLLAAASAGCRAREAAGTRLGSGGEGFPVVLADAQRVEVRVDARPERIVSAAPTVTEILFALGAGDRVVAVSDQCDYPPEAKGLPRTGGFFTPSTERVLGARPDLVIGQRGNPPDFVATLRKSGVPVFTVDPQTLDDIYATISQVACIIGDEGGGDELVARMADRLGAVSAAIADVPQEERPTAFLVLQVMPPWTAGSGTFQDDAIRSAGGRNVADDVRGFKAYSMESLVAKDPDFLLLSTMEGDPERMRREVLEHPALRQLTAVKEGRLLLLDADPLMRAGPRIVEAVEAMAHAFYPERFEDKVAAEATTRR